MPNKITIDMTKANAKSFGLYLSEEMMRAYNKEIKNLQPLYAGEHIGIPQFYKIIEKTIFKQLKGYFDSQY